MFLKNIIGFNEFWMVWIGDTQTIEVPTQSEAFSLLEASGINAIASPAIELEFSNATSKKIPSPVCYKIHAGEVRKMTAKLDSAELNLLSLSWKSLEPKYPAWGLDQYNDAVNDPQALLFVRGTSLIQQIENKWQ